MAEVINVRKVMRIWKSIYVRECLFFHVGIWVTGSLISVSVSNKCMLNMHLPVSSKTRGRLIAIISFNSYTREKKYFAF